jgi:arabinan endo-1,5-alpha-L-arabinosidase
MGTVAGVLGLGLVLPAAAGQGQQFANPLFVPDRGIEGAADPGVSWFEGTYYVTSTGSDYVRTSPDLVNWHERHRLFAPGGEPQWAVNGRAGSPKIYRLPGAGGYVLLFSAQHRVKGKGCIGRAVSPDPHSFVNSGRESYGPGMPATDGPLECEGPRLTKSAYSVIDPALFHDQDTGRYWLLYKRQLQSRIDRPPEPSDIVIRPIGSDAKSNLGSPTRLVVAAGGAGVSVEAPTMVKRNGRYYLFYSIASFDDDTYGVSVAVSRLEANRPDGGNFARFGGNPIYSGRGNEHYCGVGHQDIVSFANGNWRLFAHTYLSEAEPPTNCRDATGDGRRFLVSDLIRWDVPSTNPDNGANFWPRIDNGQPSGTGDSRGIFNANPDRPGN